MRLRSDDIVSELLASAGHMPTGPGSRNRRFRVSVPDEWYRRATSKSRSLSSISLDDGDTTIKQEPSDADSEEEGDDDGTAKAAVKYPPSVVDMFASPASATRSSTSDTKDRKSVV